MKIYRFFNTILLLSLLVSFASSCSKDNDVIPNEKGKTTENESTTLSDNIECFGGYRSITFNIGSSWKLSTTSSWIKIYNTSGKEGESTVTLKFDPNTTNITRSGSIDMQISDGSVNTIFNVTQESTSGKSVDNWIADYMTYYYLWNDDFKQIKSNLDYSLEPDKFLKSAVSSISTNSDDGYNYNNTHYYYSFIDYAKYTTTEGTALTGDYGIGDIYPIKMNSNSDNVGFIINYVYPNSSAAKAGIKRGTFITHLNGQNITISNYEKVFYSLLAMDDNYGIKVGKQDYNDEGTGLTETETVDLNRIDYDQNPILESDAFDYKGHKVGYLAYTSFDMDHDESLLKEFSKFKDYGISDLILDLRYNGGGYTCTSLALASAIIGSEYKGQVYSHMTYNKERTERGESDYLYIGKEEDYPLVEKALDCSPKLKRLFVLCTDNTASSSELIINGLRGLDIDVKLIGLQTNGKNVGMESVKSSYFNNTYNFNNVSYTLYPITFYSANAKEFKDYSSGFSVDYEIDEYDYKFVDWNNYMNDPMTYSALKYIATGEWPNLSSKSTTRSFNSLSREGLKKLVNPNTLKGSIMLTKRSY